MVIDTSLSCVNRSSFLVAKGVTAVGRYYRVLKPERAITEEEAQELSVAGIEIFAVYEDTGKFAELSLTKEQGQADGREALKQAGHIGQPAGGVIYFALEGLPHGYRSEDLPAIRNYFAGVRASVGDHYQLGVYGDGIVCGTLLDEGVCAYTWLAAASTSFEGTVAFDASGCWNLAQRHLDQEDGWNGMRVDVNEAKQEFGAFLVTSAET